MSFDNETTLIRTGESAGFHQRRADFTVSAAFCAVRHSYYSQTTHALQLQQTRRVNNSG